MVAHLPHAGPKHQIFMFHKCPTKHRWNAFLGNTQKSVHFAYVFLQQEPPESVFHPCSPGFRAKNLKNAPVFHQKVCKGRTFHQNSAWTNYNIIKGKAKVVEQGLGKASPGKGKHISSQCQKRLQTKPTKRVISIVWGRVLMKLNQHTQTHVYISIYIYVGMSWCATSYVFK